MKTCSIKGCNNKHEAKGLCKKHYKKKYAKDNKKHIIKYRKQYRQKHKEEISKHQKQFYQEHKKYYKQYYQKHRDKILEQTKKRETESPRKPSEWHKKNPERARAWRRKWQKQYSKNNPKYRIDHSITEIIRQSLKGKKAGRRWEILTGYTLQDLLIHLQNQFDNKMTWDNYGSYWEIDHIKPKSLFHYSTAESKEFKQCWALDNLQPLEISKNRKKHDTFAK